MISEEGRRERFARWEILGVERIRNDLERHGGDREVGGPLEVRDLAWEWLGIKDAEAARASESTSQAELVSKPGPEMVTLKPSLWGMSIDLKEVGRRGLKWWKRN